MKKKWKIWVNNGNALYETDDLHFDVDQIWIEFDGFLTQSNQKNITNPKEKHYIIPYTKVDEIISKVGTKY